VTRSAKTSHAEDVATLIERAEAKWRAVGAAQPDLAPAIALQRLLVTRTIRTVEQLTSVPPAVTLPLATVTRKLQEGVPLLRGEELHLATDLLGPVVTQTCATLARGATGETAQRVRQCLEDGRIDMGSLLAASFERNQIAIRAKAMHESIAPDVLWLAAELAVGPAAHLAIRHLLRENPIDTGTPVRNALEGWTHGFCPACGSWPAFGEERDTGCRLRCSFCGLDWQPRKGCTYCDTTPSELTSVKTESLSPYRAELCAGCGGYLKWLVRSGPVPFELLAVEDLASTMVDTLAASQGFGRPMLPNLGGPERLPCEGIATAE